MVRLRINKIAIAYKAILMISITIKYRADESLVISIVSYRLYFIIYGRAKEISYFIEILLTDFFSFLCSFIKCYTIPYSSHSPNCIWRILTAGFAEQNGRNAKLNGRITFDY